MPRAAVLLFFMVACSHGATHILAECPAGSTYNEQGVWSVRCASVLERLYSCLPKYQK